MRGPHGRLFRARSRFLYQMPDEARHFLLSTASLGILSYEHERIDQPAIELWNTAARDSCPPDSDLDASMKRRAIDRWENEGGVMMQ